MNKLFIVCAILFLPLALWAEQADYDIANQTFPSFRADLNNQLDAVMSNNSGATAPTTTSPFMLWADTTNDLLKLRNAADSSFIDVGTLSNDNLGHATSVLTTKGDIVTFGRERTRLAVGADGQVLTARASQLTGLVWAPPVATSSKNYILDGDMNEFPNGSPRIATDDGWMSSMFKYAKYTGSVGAMSGTQSNVVPTSSATRHVSNSSLLLEPTVIDAGIGPSDAHYLAHYITGTDYKELHNKIVTLKFMVRNSTAGTYCVAFGNQDKDRSYVAEYTIATANTWEEQSITLALDDVQDDWAFADDAVGLRIMFTLAAGMDYRVTPGAWAAGNDFATTGCTSNFMSSTSNDLYLSQVQLKLGSSAGVYTGLFTELRKKALEYYVERWEFPVALAAVGGGRSSSVNLTKVPILFRTIKMRAPVVSFSTVAHFSVDGPTSDETPVEVLTITARKITTTGTKLIVVSNNCCTRGFFSMMVASATGNAHILFDARHVQTLF